MAETGKVEIAKQLLESTNKNNPHSRAWAAYWLKDIAYPETLKYVKEMLKDKDPDVRALAVNSLINFKTDDETIKELIKLLGDKAPGPRYNAIEMLAFKCRFNKKPLKNALKSKNPMVRKNAKETLKLIEYKSKRLIRCEIY